MFLLGLCLIAASAVEAQSQKVAIYDFVKVKNNRFEEALYYYQQNWKLYREAAQAKNYISSYKIVKLDGDSSAPFHLVLITEYPDSTAWKASEKNFEPILKKLRPDGPVYLNSMKADEFRQNVYFRKGETLFNKED